MTEQEKYLNYFILGRLKAITSGNRYHLTKQDLERKGAEIKVINGELTFSDFIQTYYPNLVKKYSEEGII